MKVIASYLLALLGGNPSPSAKDIKKILASVGAEADDDRITFLLDELEGKDIVEVIASGKHKLASVPAGGGGGGGGAVVLSTGPAVTAAAAEAPKEEKEEKKEPEEESDEDMGFSLFD